MKKQLGKVWWVMWGVVLLAAACDQTESEANTDNLPVLALFGTVNVERDDGTTVECAWYDGSSAGGLSCNWEATNR